jgi:hypothetical protein
MSRQVSHWNSWDHDKIHREKVKRKAEKIQGLRALLEMWEERPDQVEHEYLLALRARLRSAENQLDVMKP